MYRLEGSLMQVSGQSTGPTQGDPELTIAPMCVPDVSAVQAILKESPEASMWSEESLLESASTGVAWVARLNGTVVGILIGRGAADEFEILNMAVGKTWRRGKVATRLVEAALERARSAGARKTYLEVRASNEGGVSFYKRIGFRDMGRRPDYYARPKEDAVLLVLKLSGTDP
jgi:ribosomal protein S18 acetylase RimI-like enzyme